MSDFESGSMEDLVIGVADYGFRTTKIQNKKNANGKPIWWNYAKSENREGKEFTFPKKGDMINFHWYKKKGTKTVYVDSIKILAAKESLEEQPRSDPWDDGAPPPSIHDTPPPGADKDYQYSPEDPTQNKPKQDVFARAPYGWNSVEEYQNNQRDTRLQIMFSVSENNATSLIKECIDKEKFISDKDYRKEVLEALKDTALDLMLFWVDEVNDITDAYTTKMLDNITDEEAQP